MLYLGCLAGVFAGAGVAGEFGLEWSRVVPATIVLLVPALAGARMWFVVEHWGVYRREPGRIWRRSEGGAALFGGLLLSVVISIPLLALLEIPFWSYWDVASITMLTGLIFTRVGCLMHGCCAGRATSGRLGVLLPDDRGIWERRIPTPLLEAGWAALVLAGAFLVHASRPFAGAIFLGVLVAYGACRLLLERTRVRADWGASRANIVFSALLLLGGVVALIASTPT